MFWIFSSSVQKKTISKVAATSTTAQPIPTQTRQQPQQQQTTSQTKEKEIKQSHRQPKTATAAIVRNSDQSSDIEMDPEQNALDCVRFKFERICHAIDGTNGKERLKKVIEIDEKVQEKIGKKFQHFTFEKMYNHGLKFMSGGVNERFHVIASNASDAGSTKQNCIDVYMLRKTEAFPPEDPYIGECICGHYKRQMHRIQEIRGGYTNVCDRVIKGWLEQNGANLRSRYITFQLAKADPTKENKERHSKFLEACILRLLCFHFENEMKPINFCGASTVGGIPLAISRFTKSEYDIMSVAVVLLSAFLDPPSLTEYEAKKIARSSKKPTVNHFYCTLCPAHYTWPTGLNKHMQAEHPAAVAAAKAARAVPSQKRFYCDVCSTSYYDLCTLKKHIYNKHDVTPPRQTDKWLNMDRPFKCSQCTKAYVSSDGLKKHLKVYHTDS